MKEFLLIIFLLLFSVVLVISIEMDVPSDTHIPITTTIEGHDYFIFRVYGGYGLCHKGNCRACNKGL